VKTVVKRTGNTGHDEVRQQAAVTNLRKCPAWGKKAKRLIRLNSVWTKKREESGYKKKAEHIEQNNNGTNEKREERNPGDRVRQA